MNEMGCIFSAHGQLWMGNIHFYQPLFGQTPDGLTRREWLQQRVPGLFGAVREARESFENEISRFGNGS